MHKQAGVHSPGFFYAGPVPVSRTVFLEVVYMKPEVKELFLDAQLKFVSDEYEESIELFHKVLEVDPGCAKAYQAIAVANVRLERVDQAIENIDRALECEPENPRLHYHKGAILFHSEKLDEAIESLSRAITLDPTYAPAYTLRSSVFEALGEEEASGADLNYALNLRKEENRNSRIVDL